MGSVPDPFALTLGSFEMGGDIDTKHESGHYHQSRVLGPLYLFVIAIPSLLHAWYFTIKTFIKDNIINPIKKKHGKNAKDVDYDTYFNFYTESWANNWADWKK